MFKRILLVFTVSIAFSANAQEAPTTYKKVGDTHIIYDENSKEVKQIWGKLTPDQKCTDIDARIFHMCLEPRFFDPSARVYFDGGADDADEIDIFNDGGLNPTIDFAAVYVPWRLGHSDYFEPWSWGPIIGVGISAPANDSESGSSQASQAPVVMVSAGLMLEYEVSEGGASFALEVGRATGFSADESLSDIDDSATYVGLKINVPMGKKKEKTATLQKVEADLERL